jgi:hypothetical protein
MKMHGPSYKIPHMFQIDYPFMIGKQFNVYAACGIYVKVFRALPVVLVSNICK